MRSFQDRAYKQKTSSFQVRYGNNVKALAVRTRLNAQAVSTGQ